MQMNRKRQLHCAGQATFLIIVLLILFLSAVGVSGYFYYIKEKMVERYLSKVDTLNKKIITLNEYTKELDIENKELQNHLIDKKSELEEYKLKHAEQEGLMRQMAEIKIMLDEQFVRVSDSLSDGFEKLDGFTRTFDARFENYAQQNKDELSQLFAAKETKREKYQRQADVELSKLVVRPTRRAGTPPIFNEAITAPKPLPPKQLKVMKVNLQHRFFVINEGLIDGIKTGSAVEVSRGATKVADAIITEVRELVSLAKIEQYYDGHFIQEGDSVRVK